MSFLDSVKAAGVVGAGGAGFPTHVKLSVGAGCFIINAAECEPLIETDKYLCRTFALELVKAAAEIAAHLGAKRTVIALKRKYKAEIAALSSAIRETGADVEIFPMGTFYPAGDEQIIVQQVCGVSVPERGIPINVGAVVNNVGTVLNVGDALKGIPVTEKYLSVVGEVGRSIMVKAPLGTPITACIEAAEPTVNEYAVILGGPMMGKLLTGHDIQSACVTKTTGNILVLPLDHHLVAWEAAPMSRIRLRAKSACIQCRMCTDLCPRYMIGHRIRPHLVMRSLWREPEIEDNGEFERAFGDAANCCDCGACEMFSCPMGLSPRRVNGYMKDRLRERGINAEKNMSPAVSDEIESRRIPTERLVSRLGLMPYYGKDLAEGYVEIAPEIVHIPLRQHIGAPAEPIRTDGERVEKGQMVARASRNGLSANIHASLTGVIAKVSDQSVEIHREGR